MLNEFVVAAVCFYLILRTSIILDAQRQSGNRNWANVLLGWLAIIFALIGVIVAAL